MFDPAFARRHLLEVPRDIVVPELPPGVVVETRESRNLVVPAQPPWVYNEERHIVIVEGRELPYITIPVLFEKETAKLLDVESRLALEEMATAILEVLKTQPTAVFDIEGHTSTDDTPPMETAIFCPGCEAGCLFCWCICVNVDRHGVLL